MKKWHQCLCILLALTLSIPIAIATQNPSNPLQFNRGTVKAPAGVAYVVVSMEGQGTGFTFSTTNQGNPLSRELALPGTSSCPKDTYALTMTCYDAAGNVTQTLLDTLPNYGTTTPLPLHIGSSIANGAPRLNHPEGSRAVMAPFADVYENDNLSHRIAQLKRHDLVNIIEITGQRAHVRFTLQSDQADRMVVSNIDAVYVDVNAGTNTYEGWMDTAAFQLDNQATSQTYELWREVVELAYSRLGLKGIYSQSKRYQDYYLDCSALAAWCWYQVGVDISQYGTSVTGLANWAQAHPETWVWRATENRETAQNEIAEYKASLPNCLGNNYLGRNYCTGEHIVHIDSYDDGTPDSVTYAPCTLYSLTDATTHHCSCMDQYTETYHYSDLVYPESVDTTSAPAAAGARSAPDAAPPEPTPYWVNRTSTSIHDGTCNCDWQPDPLVFGKWGAITEDCLVTYDNVLTENDLPSIQAGDIVFFNFMWDYDDAELQCQYGYGGENDLTGLYAGFNHNFKGNGTGYHIIEPGSIYGYDHVGIVVGVDEQMGPSGHGQYLTIIHTSNPTNNTVVSEYLIGDVPTKDIVAIMRPTNAIH